MNEERRLNEEMKEELARLRKQVRKLEQEQGKIQETLKDSEERLRLIYENSPLGMGFVSLDGILVDCNDALAAIIGTPRERLTGFSMKQKITNEAVAAALARAFTGSVGAFEGEYAAVTSGKRLALRAIFAPLFARTGALKGVLFIAEDISERKRVEDALHESENRYRQLFDAESDAIFLIDNASGNILMANDAASALYGYSAKELLSKKNTDLSAEPSETRRVTEESPVVKDNRVTIPLRYHRKKDGAIFPVEITGRFFEYQNRPVHIAAIRDITERKKAEDRLRASEARLRTVTENAPDTILQVDRQGTITFVNRPVPGLTVAQIVGTSVYQWVPQEQHPVVARALEQAFATGQRQEYESAGPGPGGEVRYYYVRVMPVMVAGQADSAIYIATDITEHRQAEEALRRSELSFRSIIEYAASGVVVADAKTGQFLYANPEICRMLGYGSEELLALGMAAIHPPSEREQVRRSFEAHEGIQTECLRKDGTTFPVDIKAVAIELEGRQCLVGFFTDMTERRLLEEERLKTQKLESIGTLAGGIAHDFNNLLQGVFGYISVAKMSIDHREKALAMLELAEKALHLSVNLTTQLLTFSKGGAPVKKRVEVLPMVESSAKFALSGSRAHYRLSIGEQTCAINADEGQISQVVQNIVLNADQSMPRGGTIEIGIRNVVAGTPGAPQALGPGDFVAISVRDSGVGIPASDLSRIFDPYFTTKEKGSGLGLATSYSIVKNHGGLIDVLSEVGKGSVFTVYLPAAEAGEEEEQKRPAAPPAGMQCRILVMDDEEVVRTVADELLRTLGHEADTAEHGAAAIEKFQQARASGRPYDVVILDLTIRGGLGGLETLCRLKEIDPEVTAVVSSGYSDDDVASDYRARGFRAFLQKPYDMESLKKTLDGLLG